jgi:hypothetical protein
MEALWNSNPQLAGASRWWRGSTEQPASDFSVARSASYDLAILFSLGLLAALATSAGNFGLRLPGHAILRGALPFMLGLSLVPRRSSGIVMSASAALALGLMKIAGFGPPNPASIAGLIFLGPALDMALSTTRGGWQLYLRAAAAGMTANLLAFAVRLASASVLAEAAGGGRGFLSFWPVALLSFALLGALAGLISGAAWFRAQPRDGAAS